MAAIAIAALPAVLQLAPLIRDAITNIESIFQQRREAAKTPAEINAVNGAKMAAVVDIARLGAIHMQSSGIIPEVPEPTALAAQAQQIFNDAKLGKPRPGASSARLLSLVAELMQYAADQLMEI